MRTRLFGHSLFLPTAITAVLLVGCGTTMRVKKVKKPGDPTNSNSAGGAVRVPGVPFYVKRGGCLQKTVYLEPLALVTLTIGRTDNATQESDTLFRGQVLLRAAELRDSAFTKLRALVDDLGVKAEAMPRDEAVQRSREAVQLLRALDPYDYSLPDSAHMVSNSAKPIAYVDYSRRYYFNGKRPFIGGTTVALELATDGTLSKGSVAVAEEGIGAILAPAAAVAAAAVPVLLKKREEEKKTAGEQRSFELSVSTVELRHAMSEMFTAADTTDRTGRPRAKMAKDGGCQVGSPILLGDSTAAYSRSTFVTGTPRETKSPGRQLGVQGTGTLPREDSGGTSPDGSTRKQLKPQ